MPDGYVSKTMPPRLVELNIIFLVISLYYIRIIGPLNSCAKVKDRERSYLYFKGVATWNLRAKHINSTNW